MLKHAHVPAGQVRAVLRDRQALAAENLRLRQQLAILARSGVTCADYAGHARPPSGMCTREVLANRRGCAT